MQDLEKETGRQYFNTQLFAIRVKEIYKILKEKGDISESNQKHKHRRKTMEKTTRTCKERKQKCK